MKGTDFVLIENNNENQTELKQDQNSNKNVDMPINIKKENKPLPNCKKIETIGDLDIYLYNSVEFTEEEKSQAITLMVLGGTEAGKTTLLNSYLNYLLGVESTDKFRYKIINEEIKELNDIRFKSRTTKVTAYNIRSKKGKPFILIDTPGFIYFSSRYDFNRKVESNIINNDINTFSLIKDFLIEHTSAINVICFAINEGYTHYFDTFKWRFDNMLNLFADDIKENIIIVGNFWDGNKEINYLLEKEDCILNSIIPYKKKEDFYFKFNNSVFMRDYKSGGYLFELFWKMNKINYEKFTNKIEKLKPKSLKFTKQMLEKREILENNANNLINKYDNIMNIIEKYKLTLKNIEKLEWDINATKNYEFERDEYYLDKIDLSGKGINTTTCLCCNFTCDKNCSYGDNSQKKNCKVISGEYCTVCPGKCHWNNHKNFPYIIENKTRKIKVTIDDLKKLNLSHKKKLKEEQDFLNELKNLKNKEYIEYLLLYNKTLIDVEKLKEIALNKKSYDSIYLIDILIDLESHNKKENYSERVKSLNKLKRKYQLLSDLFKRNENKEYKDLEKIKKIIIDD